jgi:hypothetical protein
LKPSFSKPRDVHQLLNLTPRVQNVQNENSIGPPMEHVIINASNDNIVGQVTYYLDGGINITGARATGNVIPNPDAVDQFSLSGCRTRTTSGSISLAPPFEAEGKLDRALLAVPRCQTPTATPALCREREGIRCEPERKCQALPIPR